MTVAVGLNSCVVLQPVEDNAIVATSKAAPIWVIFLYSLDSDNIGHFQYKWTKKANEIGWYNHAKGRRSLPYQGSDFCVQTLSETCLAIYKIYKSLIRKVILNY